jgi:serine O-acetyltransferase
MAVRRQQQDDEYVDSEVPDWSREEFAWWEWTPSRRLLRSIRDYQRGSRQPHLRMLAVLRHRFWSLITGTDIPLNASLGGGLLMPHPNGIVIHPDVKIGPNCLIFQQVTLGTGGRPGLPILEGHVDIGAGAKILGGVRVGSGAKIGANAVVIDDVPTDAVAVGVPARILDQSVALQAVDSRRPARIKVPHRPR